MKYKLYYAETGHGCCVRRLKVRSIVQARAAILREAGTAAGVTLVREATSRDVAWVKTMGGAVQ